MRAGDSPPATLAGDATKLQQSMPFNESRGFTPGNTPRLWALSTRRGHVQ